MPAGAAKQQHGFRFRSPNVFAHDLVAAVVVETMAQHAGEVKAQMPVTRPPILVPPNLPGATFVEPNRGGQCFRQPPSGEEN